MEEKGGSRKKLYTFRLTDPNSQPESLWMVKWNELGAGYLNTNSTHGLNPHISHAAAACKLIVWVLIFLMGVTGLVVHFYAMTTTFLSYEVVVSTKLSHVREMTFPAVTICNMNPIKSSLLDSNSRLSALVESWSADDRRRRDVSDPLVHSRPRRTVSLPAITDCPAGALRYGEYCYTVDLDGVDWDTAQAQCEVGGGHLVWFDNEEEHELVTQYYCTQENCEGSDKFWTGLKDSVGDNVVADYTLTWGGSPSYYKWKDGEPGGDNHLCVEDKSQQSVFEWNDDDCDRDKDYVCKYRVAEQTNTATASVLVTTACEGEAASLSCTGGTALHIISVFYGREDDTTCNPAAGSDDVCECDLTDVCGMSVVRACEDMVYCDAYPTEAFMGTAACDNEDPYLRINYTCWTTITGAAVTTVTPTTVAETTVAPTTVAETTVAPTTVAETTVAPTTVAETTVAPTTVAETTVAPTTVAETTVAPTTVEETTVAPTTVAETTIAPTTVAETTVAPTTVAETTVAPTTVAETTVAPTTVAETTVAPTTVAETTVAPTTEDITTEEPTTEVIDNIGNVEASIYEERDPYREDFLQENDFLMTLADIPVSEKEKMGYNLTDIVYDCSYGGRSCNMEHFAQFFDGTHGNCYVFNSGWDMGGIMKTAETGRESGLRLVLKIGQEEYLPSVGEAAGAVVVIHPQERFPFPEDEGILLLPGHINSIGTREVTVYRLGGIYNNCTNSHSSQEDINIFEELYPETSYSRTACYKTCYQKYVIKTCGCADPAYPMQGKALGTRNVSACDARDVAQDDCVYGVGLDYIQGKLDCTCHNPCSDKSFRYFPTKTLWPTEAGEETFQTRYADAFESFANFSDDPEFYRRNFLMVEVFFETLQLKNMTEVPKYKIESYVADIGGTIGLWLGLTLLSVFEYFELVVDAIVLACIKLFNRSRNRTPVTPMKPTVDGRESTFGSIGTESIRSDTSETSLIRRRSISNVGINEVHWDN